MTTPEDAALTIHDVRVVRGVALPGATATTFGRTVFVRAGAPFGPRLQRHELEHVRQYAQLGRVRFLVRYIGEYLRWRLRGHRHRGAYRRITFEIRAEWRARRDTGIGVVARPGDGARSAR